MPQTTSERENGRAGLKTNLLRTQHGGSDPLGKAAIYLLTVKLCKGIPFRKRDWNCNLTQKGMSKRRRIFYNSLK